MNTEIQDALQIITGSTARLSQVKPMSGGSINSVARVISDGVSYFVKWNSSDLYPGMFDAEIKGLEAIGATKVIRTPRVIGQVSVGNRTFLFLEFIEHAHSGSSFFQKLGEQLARLHHTVTISFGLDHDNYIGSLRQVNGQCQDWIPFFIKNRLSPLVKSACNAGLLDNKASEMFDQLFYRLPDLIPYEAPSLLHGDLWSGNCFAGPDGLPVLVDPAVYYGNREMDLAMTRLFGGFSPVFYDSYNNSFPLQYGWEERIPLHNLYPLLVHLNLFGKGYLADILQTLRRYTG